MTIEINDTYNLLENSWQNREGSVFKDYYNNNFPKLV